MRYAAIFLVAAIALPARATPDAVVRAFYEAYAAGDVANASRFWEPAAALAFARKAERHFRARCLTHHEIRIEAPGIDGDKVTIDAEAFVTVNGAWTETRFTTFELVNGRITRWTDREAALADRVSELKSPDERRARLVNAGRLRTPRLAWELCRKALALLNRHEVAIATELIDAAGEIAVETGDDAALSVVRGVEGWLLVHGPADRHERAIEVANEAVMLAERSKNPDAIARALLRLGTTVHGVRSTIHRETFERILSYGDSVDDAAILAHAASYLGFLASATMDASSVLRHGLTALGYAEISGQEAALVNAHFAIGQAYWQLGHGGVARRHYARSLEVAERAGFTSSAALALLGIARVANLRDREEALRVVERALQFATDVPRAELLMFRVDNAIGRDAAAIERDLDDAASSLPPRHPHRVTILVVKSELRFRQGRADQALEIANEALRFDGSGPLRMVAVTHALRLLRRMKRYEEARVLAAEIRCLLATVPASRGFEESSWALHFGFHSQSESELLAFAVETNDAAEAVRLANDTRARALRVFTERRTDLPSRLMNDEDRARAQSLEQQLAELNRRFVAANVAKTQLSNLTKEIERVRFDLAELHARAAAVRARHIPMPSAIADPLTLAPAHTIVQFVESNDSVIILGLGPGSGPERRVIVTQTAISTTEVTRRIDALLELMERRDLRYASAARELFDVLLGPVASLIGPDAMLCIIPDSALWRLPFHALRTPDGTYLADVTPVFYAPAMSLAEASAPRRSPGAPSLVAFANPEIHARSVAQYRSAFSGGEVGRLPEAEDEVREVARLYGGNSRVYIGERATESTLKREAWRADIIHIATHGAVDPASPLASAMLLAPGTSTEDGVLEAREILELDLEANLAVLSACNTGSGQTVRGEGIIGLSWAFLASGCPTAVASHWNATSNVTSWLMTEFHRQLRAGHSAAVALQKAQKKVRTDERYRHPYYWAPFVVIGAQ